MSKQKGSRFIVTEKAMRPASSKKECFYCNQPISEPHGTNCVLIKKNARVRFIAEYHVEMPNRYDKGLFESSRNEGTWCFDNAISELIGISEANGCLCGFARFEYLGEDGEPYLNEG